MKNKKLFLTPHMGLSEHTPTPRLESGDTDGDVYPVNTKDGKRFSDCYSMENQELIVRAVNAHEELIAALKAVLNCTEMNLDDMDETSLEAGTLARKALAKAEGR